MKALIAYDSTYGNTELVARAVAAGLGTRDEVELRRVERMKLHDCPWDLVVLGAPTERHGVGYNTQRLLNRIDGLRDVPVAVFDTRYHLPRLITGSAATSSVPDLRRAGAVLMADPQSFFVRSAHGPLEAGEEKRARAWGAELRRLFDAQPQRREAAPACGLG